MIRPKKRTKLPLIDQILRRRAKIGILGLGYVGLPLALAFARHGFVVTGFDVDGARIARLQGGESPLAGVTDPLLADLVAEGRLRFKAGFRDLKKQQVILICVPTPLRKTRDPDISHILAAVQEVAAQLKAGQLIVLESTTYPGTTEEILLPALEAQGLKVGRDFNLAFSPERLDPGNETYHLGNTPKIVGGITPTCTRLAALLYHTVVERVFPVRNARTAELVKQLENTFRAVNIGVANEFAQICEKFGADVWEVIAAAATKPFGFMPFYPGPGLGGHCIPLDPQYLSWKLKALNYQPRFIDLATNVNLSMPEYVFGRVQSALNAAAGKALKGAKILLVGVTYKKNVADTRESPAYELGRLLHAAGARLNYADPLIPEWEAPWGRAKAKKLSPQLLRAQDLALIVTDHDALSLDQVVLHSPLVFDTRGATQGLRSKNVVRL